MTSTAKKEILKQQCYANFPYLIIISEETSGTELCYANMDSDVDVTIDGEVKTFSAHAFSLSTFTYSEDKISNGSLTLYDSALEIIPIVRNVNKRFSIRFVKKINYQKDGEWTMETIDDVQGTLSDFSWSDDGTISCSIVFDEDMDIVMPIDKFDSVNCPALF
jgi:hypothetical protein